MSISADNTVIASAYSDRVINLWNTETEKCISKEFKDGVNTITFSPVSYQLLALSYNDAMQQWDISGHKIGSLVSEKYIAFSPDSTWFTPLKDNIVTTRNPSSRTITQKFNPNYGIECCYFSPNGRFIAVAAHHTIKLWDITGPNPCLIQTLTCLFLSI